jgi:ADP-ribose pyrophosphatase YjhB (NUDIX family)
MNKEERGERHWLSDEEWKRAQATLPICCVDVVPVRRGPADRVEAVGMILRDTPHQGRRWCLVGGRMLRDESMAQAVARQIRETLGDAARFQIDPAAQPQYVAQYFTTEQPVGLLDPRQHAIGLTFIVEITGEINTRGEAFEFRWFAPGSLAQEQCGFGQDAVVRACLRIDGMDA